MSHSIDDCYSVYNERPTKARKPRTCDACGETIEAGCIYMHVFAVFDGNTTRVDRCGACQKTHEHLRGLAPGEMWPDECLSCGLIYEDEWGHEPPDEIARLPLMSAREAGALLAEEHAAHLAKAREYRARRRALKATVSA